VGRVTVDGPIAEITFVEGTGTACIDSVDLDIGGDTQQATKRKK